MNTNILTDAVLHELVYAIFDSWNKLETVMHFNYHIQDWYKHNCYTDLNLYQIYKIHVPVQQQIDYFEDVKYLVYMGSDKQNMYFWKITYGNGISIEQYEYSKLKRLLNQNAFIPVLSDDEQTNYLNLINGFLQFMYRMEANKNEN